MKQFVNSMYEMNPVICQTCSLSDLENNLEFPSNVIKWGGGRCIHGLLIKKIKKPGRQPWQARICVFHSENGEKNKARMWKKGGKWIWDLIWKQLFPATLPLKERDASNSMRYRTALARRGWFLLKMLNDNYQQKYLISYKSQTRLFSPF